MLTYAYLIKAKAKATEAKNLFCWFSAKSDSRAEREILNILEDNGIAVGRGADYQLPARTNWFVVDDLPEESTLNDTWCDRYELAEDQRTWQPKAAGAVDATIPADVKTTDEVATADENVSLENRTPAVRFAVHLMNDKYQTHVTKEQQLAASEMSLDEGNIYLQNLLQAKNDTPEVGELSLNAEWKMIQAIKDIFEQGEEHEPEVIAAFMSDWVTAEAADRNQLVEDWRSGKFPLLKTETTSGADVTTGQDLTVFDGTQFDVNSLAEDGVVGGEVGTEEQSQQSEQPNLLVVATLPFRQRVLAQFIGDGEYLYHVDAGQKNEIVRLEMDTDDAYVQNLLLAAENVGAFKKAIEHDIHKVVNAVKKVFPVDGKKPELATVIQFLTVWFKTDYIDRGILAREWAAGNRISNVQRTDSGTNALLPMDFNHLEIPGSIHRRSKEIVANKEQPWKSWSSILRNQPGVLSVNRAAIFNLVRIAPDNIHLTPVAHLEFVNQTMTAEFNSATELMPLPAAQPETETHTAEEHRLPRWAEAGEQQLADEDEAETQNLPKWANAAGSQPQVESLGGGVFSIEGLMGNQPAPTLSALDQVRQSAGEEKLHQANTEAATSNVQMEETNNNEIKTSPEVSQGETAVLPVKSADATGGASASLNNEPVHHIDTDPLNAFYTHLMVDMETMGNSPHAPIVSIGAVFFDPSTGNTGAEFYQVVCLESSMSFGMKPDASTIQWWLKQSSEARSAILVDEAMGLLETLELLADYIAENAANGSHTVQLWGNGCSFDNVILRRAYALTDTPFAVPFWNDRDVRTMVELGKSVGINPRFDIPFEGDMHNALSDARHQVKYVSAIWQRLTAN
ncbi:3'-5' exoribonuclease [Citrobacter freundii]|uniref:3'-5' exoribonuclease domain-containing protein n=2 Tax=Citrobacter TaxID=544 RepID=UPI0015EA486E|nr:3'-5' exoribonuclease [Citrobacter freundii]QMD27459.1 3'-5' exoribonuclease [Citrobacter freundii]